MVIKKFILFLVIIMVSCAAQPKLTEREIMKQKTEREIMKRELKIILENSRRDFIEEYRDEIERLMGNNK